MPVPHIATADYNYELAPERIALHPLPERDESKLLVYAESHIQDANFQDIHQYLPADSLLLFNNSKVIPARLLYIKDSGGMIEIFCLEPKTGTPYIALQDMQESCWTCMVGGAKKWRNGMPLRWQLDTENEAYLEAELIKKNEEGYCIQFRWNLAGVSFAEVLEQLGQMPIPPYLLRKAELSDRERYQTIYASVAGSVAAPTAGLHFTDRVMQSLQEKNVHTAFTTLHVGAGTFKPVQAAFAHEHPMHAEWVEMDLATIESLATATQITCVGTTSLRSAESTYWYALEHKEGKSLDDATYLLPQFTPYEYESTESRQMVFARLAAQMKERNLNRILFRTELMIMPGYPFPVADNVITNFHQPKSTLLLLVDAFTQGQWKEIYKHALKKHYRFLSYGDSSLLKR